MLPNTEQVSYDQTANILHYWYGKIQLHAGGYGTPGYMLAGSGVVTDTENAGTGAIVIDPSAGEFHQVTLNANVTGITLATNQPGVPGQMLRIKIIQAASGGPYTCTNTVFPGSFVFQSGTYAVSTQASAYDLLTFIYDGTNWIEQSIRNGRAGTPLVAVTVNATQALDFTQGLKQKLTISTANVSAAGITVASGKDAPVGAEVLLWMIPDGSHTCTQASFATVFKFAGASYTITSSASQPDLLKFTYDGTNYVLTSITQAVH